MSTYLKDVQEIFSGRFKNCRTAVIQKCEDKDSNIEGLHQGYTEHWPIIKECEMAVIVIKDKNRRNFYCGLIIDVLPSLIIKNKYRILVDKFDYIGTHNLSEVGDSEFYGKGRGGGSRVYAENNVQNLSKQDATENTNLNFGENTPTTIQARKNHHQFRNKVYTHWNGNCAVLGHPCDGFLVASHIKPWAESNPQEKVDKDNGLLLSIALDKLFDKGKISFSNDGVIIINKTLSKKTLTCFGIKETMSINKKYLTKSMKNYLVWHREKHGL